MPRARSKIYDEDAQTAAAEIEDGGGCLSAFALPPLAVLAIGFLLSVFILRLPISMQAQTSSSTANSTTAPLLSGLAPFFTPEVQSWSDSILRWAAASNLDPNLVAVVMQIESCGDPRARSRAGAMGLFQVMPSHFLTIDDPYDPETNAARGLAYLARSLQTANGDARLALAGYNGGIGVIGRSEWLWPSETQRYVYFGALMYADAQQGLSFSAAREEWYRRYGASLCQQAHQRLGLP